MVATFKVDLTRTLQMLDLPKIREDYFHAILSRSRRVMISHLTAILEQMADPDSRRRLSCHHNTNQSIWTILMTKSSFKENSLSIKLDWTQVILIDGSKLLRKHSESSRADVMPLLVATSHLLLFQFLLSRKSKELILICSLTRENLIRQLSLTPISLRFILRMTSLTFIWDQNTKQELHAAIIMDTVTMEMTTAKITAHKCKAPHIEPQTSSHLNSQVSWMLILTEHHHQEEVPNAVQVKLEVLEANPILSLLLRWSKDFRIWKMARDTLTYKIKLCRQLTHKVHGPTERRNGTSLTRDCCSQLSHQRLQTNGLRNLAHLLYLNDDINR